MSKFNLPVDYDKLTQRERRLVRIQYMMLQHERCSHCEGPLSEESLSPYKISKRLISEIFPPGFLDNPVHLHHDHNTGLTIGAVHAYCNAVLWVYFGE